tara:strand:+ start:132 stop:341 length:210 start_codon:yes stop_codon:yes gene_type:complete
MKIHKDLVSIVFKTSNRSNAKTKIKTFRNKCIDDVLKQKKIVGIPENSIILEIGMGKYLQEKYKKKYKL